MSNPFTYVILKKLAVLPTPLFVKLRLSANQIRLFRFVLAFLAAFVIITGNLIGGISLWIFSRIIDYVNINIARLTRGASLDTTRAFRCLQEFFCDKFADGMIDIASECFLKLALSYVAFTFQNYPLMWIGIIDTAITPFHNLIFDRYSAYARWINKEKALNINPYIRGTICLKFMNLLADIKFLSLIIVCAFFLAAWAYFLVDIFIAAIYIYTHIRASYKYMNVKNE